jgi:hypothetical protein
MGEQAWKIMPEFHSISNLTVSIVITADAPRALWQGKKRPKTRNFKDLEKCPFGRTHYTKSGSQNQLTLRDIQGQQGLQGRQKLYPSAVPEVSGVPASMDKIFEAIRGALPLGR